MSEKSAILDALTRPAPGKAFSDTLIALRIWSRLKKRAEELKATIPNPSILVVALDKLCSPVLATNPNISFRIAAFRHELHIDTIPTYEKVDSLSQVILAELEGAVGNESQMARKDRLAVLAENSDEGKAKGKGKQDDRKPKDPPKPKGTEGAKSDQPQAKAEARAQVKPQCFKWITDEGCSYGTDCQYTHEPVVKGRCYNCAATTHLKPEIRCQGSGGKCSIFD